MLIEFEMPKTVFVGCFNEHSSNISLKVNKVSFSDSLDTNVGLVTSKR